VTTFNVRTANLRAVNSMTKYPSIPTYHALDPRNGGLLDETVPFTGAVIGTEKVDGTNARIVLLPDGSHLLGSREELLYAQGDLIGNPSQGIVDALRPVADRLVGFADDAITVVYVELYGGRIGGNAKQYTARGEVGWRLFDIARVEGHEEVAGWPPERISAWREGGGQSWQPEHTLTLLAGRMGVALVPRLFRVDAADLPTGLEKTRAWLEEYAPRTLVALGETTPGRAEGIVLRTENRSTIAKARFQDYDRTLKRRGGR
jgi:hypothetical protein